jgi:hypothetical protein
MKQYIGNGEYEVFLSNGTKIILKEEDLIEIKKSIISAHEENKEIENEYEYYKEKNKIISLERNELMKKLEKLMNEDKVNKKIYMRENKILKEKNLEFQKLLNQKQIKFEDLNFGY